MPTILDYSEDDISAKYITPALARAGWDEAQIRRQYRYAPGRVIVRGKAVGGGRSPRRCAPRDDGRGVRRRHLAFRCRAACMSSAS